MPVRSSFMRSLVRGLLPWKTRNQFHRESDMNSAIHRLHVPEPPGHDPNVPPTTPPGQPGREIDLPPLNNPDEVREPNDIPPDDAPNPDPDPSEPPAPMH